MLQSAQHSRAAVLVGLSVNEGGMLDEERVRDVLVGVSALILSRKRELLREYKRQIGELERQQQAEVVSAVGLSREVKSVVLTQLRGRHPHMNNVTWTIDQDILGGLTVQIGDTWYDQSLQHRLDMIKEQLG